MKLISIICALPLFLFVSSLHAKEYGNYDPKSIVKLNETTSGKKTASIDIEYLDRIIGDLSAHAQNYPPRFDTPEDQKRAAKDVMAVAKLMDILTEGANVNPDILLRAAYVNSIAHNLEIKGAAEKASTLYQRLLKVAPANPRANYLYGAFLGSIGKPQDGIAYLEKAYSAGVDNAAYALGISYLGLGNNTKAIEYLEIYRAKNRDDKNVAVLIEAIKSGKITRHETK